MRRIKEALGPLLALLFLLGNLAARAHALHAAGARAWDVFVLAAVLAAALALVRPSLLAPALTVFGASLFLYGFHAYRLPSQAFELLVTTLALVLLVRGAGREVACPAGGGGLVLPLFATYALVATASLLLLPPVVIEHRIFRRGARLPRGRSWTRSRRTRCTRSPPSTGCGCSSCSPGCCRPSRTRSLSTGACFRGIAWAALVAVVLGLLDFLGVISLARYNSRTSSTAPSTGACSRPSGTRAGSPAS